MKKTLKWLAIIICVVAIAAIAGMMLFGGAMIKSAVNTAGPAAMRVAVSLEKADFNPLAGKLNLGNLKIGNPEGFNTPSLFELAELEVELDVASLFSDTIVVRKVKAVAPHITYEKALLGSNFGALMKGMQGEKKEEAAEAEPAADKAAPKAGKKVVIEELVISDPSLNVSITAAGGHYIPVKLGQIELKDIGKASGGVTFADAIKIIFSVITSNIESATANAADIIGDGAKAVTGGVKAVGGGVVEGAASAAAGVGGAVSDGVSAVVKGVGSLFGGEKKSEGEQK